MYNSFINLVFKYYFISIMQFVKKDTLWLKWLQHCMGKQIEIIRAKVIAYSERKCGMLNRLSVPDPERCVELPCCLIYRHPTSCCSAAEIMSVLFFHNMKLKVQEPRNPNNDRFVLSKVKIDAVSVMFPIFLHVMSSWTLFGSIVLIF